MFGVDDRRHASARPQGAVSTVPAALHAHAADLDGALLRLRDLRPIVAGPARPRMARRRRPAPGRDRQGAGVRRSPDTGVAARWELICRGQGAFAIEPSLAAPVA